MGNLVVKDDEYGEYVEAIKTIGVSADAEIAQYLTILNTVLNSAIQDGVIYQNLSVFYTQAQALSGLMGSICEDMSMQAGSYRTEIDQKDQDLY